jgi:oxygen-dependent protoporphyrinogen oxidase
MRVAIVGGGVAGLTLALALRDRGHEPLVLEREPRPGGKVGTERVGDWQVERGPAGVLDDAPATQALLDRFGIERVPSDAAARRRFVVRGGRLREVPASPPQLLLSTTLTVGEKWRLMREPHAPPPPEGGDETVAEFARRRVGASLAAAFVEPMVRGVYAGDYARLSLRSAFPRVAQLEREHGSLLRGLIAAQKARTGPPPHLISLKGGMGALPAALAAALGPSLRCGAAVTSLARAGSGWQLATAGGPVEAERVVLALPPDDAAALVRPVDAALGDAWASIPAAGAVAVSLGYARADVAHPLDGFGFLVPQQEGGRLLGVLWMTSTFPTAAQAPAGHVMLRCLLGGAQDPGATALTDEALLALARDELRARLAVTAAPAFTHVVRWPHGIPQYEVGHAARVETIEARGAPLGLYATGAGLRGVGVNDVVREAAALAERFGST